MIGFTGLGLIFGFIGASVFAIEGTRLVTHPIFRERVRWNRKHQAIDKLVNDTKVENQESEFSTLMSLVKRNVSSSDIPEQPTEINYKNRFDMGANIAIEEGDERFFVGSPARLRNWVERETRELFFRWGMIFIAIGFGLQFLGTL